MNLSFSSCLFHACIFWKLPFCTTLVFINLTPLLFPLLCHLLLIPKQIVFHLCKQIPFHLLLPCQALLCFATLRPPSSSLLLLVWSVPPWYVVPPPCYVQHPTQSEWRLRGVRCDPISSCHALGSSDTSPQSQIVSCQSDVLDCRPSKIWYLYPKILPN